MSYVAQQNAIRTRFFDEWNNRTPVAYPNTNFEPPSDCAWVRLDIGNADARQASFGDPGNNVYRHVGVVTVMIFTLLGQGEAEAYELADRVQEIFRGWEDLGSGVRFRVAPYVREVPGQESKWYHVNVLLPFERDSLF